MENSYRRKFPHWNSITLVKINWRTVFSYVTSQHLINTVKNNSHNIVYKIGLPMTLKRIYDSSKDDEQGWEKFNLVSFSKCIPFSKWCLFLSALDGWNCNETSLKSLPFPFSSKKFSSYYIKPSRGGKRDEKIVIYILQWVWRRILNLP